MAAITGTVLDSITARTCGSQGLAGVLPNSLISAPAMKVWPSQCNTMALQLDAAADLKASIKPLRTGSESALTGGLSTVIVTMSSWSSKWTKPFMKFLHGKN
jgi:hypothetical protein